MITKYLGATTVVLLLALVASGLLYRNAAEARAVAEAQRDGYLEALDFQSDQIERRDALLAQREEQRLTAERAAVVWRRKWKEAQRNDANCKKWVDTELPACVMELFTQSGSGSDRQPGSGSLFEFNP